MSETADRQDRTEAPTPKRLRQAREKGDVPRSKELGNVAVLGVAAIVLLATAPAVGRASQAWLRDALRFDRALLGDPAQLLPHAAALAGGLMLPLLPLFAATLLACLVAPAAMGGLRFATKALQPDFKRLDPIKGLARVYGREALVELLRSLLRVGLVCGAGALVIHQGFSTLVALPRMDLAVATAASARTVMFALLAMAGSLAVLAAIDVPWQHWNWRSKLKMTKQELRDELKETEGNPELKARVRQVARQMSQRRMMEAVPTADVIVTNPTHYAVALRYDAGRMRAPTVVAKGVDELALQIRKVGAAHRVGIVEAPPLARALYRHAQVDREIPSALYVAVAQVLSYIYQLKRWHPSRGPMPALGELPVDAALADDVPPAGGTPR